MLFPGIGLRVRKLLRDRMECTQGLTTDDGECKDFFFFFAVLGFELRT
jgi:hypothetical protein